MQKKEKTFNDKLESWFKAEKLMDAVVDHILNHDNAKRALTVINNCQCPFCIIMI